MSLLPYNPGAPTKKTQANLPHWSQEGTTYWVTFRLADSLPQEKLKAWKEERDLWASHHPEPWSDADWKEYHERFGDRLESWLDAGEGACHLRRPEVRSIVERCLLHFDGDRYDLGPWVIMPNHVHLLITPRAGHPLSKIMQGIKGVSAKECNALLGRTGQTFWQEESFDHIVRSQAQYNRFVRYIAENPVKAHLTVGESSNSDTPVADSNNRSGDNLVADFNNRGSDTPVADFNPSGTRLSQLPLRSKLDHLFSYTDEPHPFTESEVATLITAIDEVKILDPACGSGAFPMGVLHKLVYILGKLDPSNERWKQTQLAKLDSAPMREALEAAFADNNDDYGRKLYLIENCLYGVDIQPIAIQITKLRFFISLVCDQRTNRNKKDNHGIRPLPNLETKFVAADTLIGLPVSDRDLFIESLIAPIEKEIEEAYHSHFTIQRRDQKLALQKKIKSLRLKLAETLAGSLGAVNSAKAKHLADWDPFDPQSTADFFDSHWMFGRALKDGFDVVIGNPPYIQIQKFPAAQKAKWTDQNFTTYTATGDIYCLFYERGAKLLRPGGHLCYITSNKWMRAGYGEQLRDFLASKVDTTAVLDFGMAQNFGAATTYTCITSLTKQATAHHTLSCYADDAESAMTHPKAFFTENAVPLTQLDSTPWVILSPQRQTIKTQVEAQGIALEKWDIQINYGIKTGFNDAFYLTQEQRNAFIAQDPACAAFLVPLLRGRHVERYATNWDGTWMINSHNGIKDRGILPVDLKTKCPVLWNHIALYERELSKRQDKGDHWSNLRNCAYLEEFQKSKIMYPNMTKFIPFYYDADGGFFGNQKCFIITSEAESLPALIAILNSSVFRCCFRDSFPELLGNTYELSKIFMDKIPIKKPTVAEAALFEKLIVLIQFAKSRRDNPVTDSSSPTPTGLSELLYDLIDACVMECYFREHMAERDLLFLDELAPHLAAYQPDASEAQQRDFLTHLHRTLNAPTSKIRNRLLRIATDSPDLLAVIKEEGRV